MAWLLVGIAGAATLSYVTSEISETWDKYTKPIVNYFDAKAREKEIQERELRRQSTIAKAKDQKVKSLERVKHHVDVNKYIKKFTNDTSNVCRIVYVNHDRAKTEEEAIIFAKQEVNASWADKTNTKVVVLQPMEEFTFIPLEFKEYVVVLNNGVAWSTLNHLGHHKDDVDLACKNWW